MLTGSQIRRKFLDFFIEKGHREVHSSSLVPANDPTLLFTNAGMNQFKDVFLGLEKRDYNRATTSQKCVRAGGKHNDLENVGFTNRHHTFFEMLGNFSFGDYFKKDAIAYAWELITSPKWFGIPKEKLYVTIFKGENGVERDSEAYDLWLGQGVPKERIYEFGSKDNFWQMGDTGPCGPCSEIHYDMGVIASDQGHGTTAPACEFGCDCGRYVEIWNLVFMQFDRSAIVENGKATGYNLAPLPKPSIDTGMGLERLASVLQGVISNYDTDLFTPLIKRAAELTGATLRKELDKESHTKSAASLRVIADHSRAATFLISDGVTPSNEGRGYVLRKIIRRAIRHGRLLGQTKPFLHQMVFAVRDLMRDAYPEIVDSAKRVADDIALEEVRFARTIAVGEERLEAIEQDASLARMGSILLEAAKVTADARESAELERKGTILSQGPRSVADVIEKAWYERIRQIARRFASFFDEDIALLLARLTPGQSDNFEKTAQMLVGSRRMSEFRDHLKKELAEHPPLFPGEEAFKLYDTFGLPLDFVQDAARDAGLRFDQAGFDHAMTEQRERAKASWKGAVKQTANPAYQQLPASTFEGYRQTRSDNCEVLAIIKNGQGAQELKPGESGEVILDHTPFYAESGGQVGDRGWFYSDDHNTVVAEVTGCYYPIQGVRAHQVIAKQPIRVGEKVDAVVNTETRAATMRNHTATHLLQAGLREVLGKHVKQAGSLVAPNHLAI